MLSKLEPTDMQDFKLNCGMLDRTIKQEFDIQDIDAEGLVDVVYRKAMRMVEPTGSEWIAVQPYNRYPMEIGIDWERHGERIAISIYEIDVVDKWNWTCRSASGLDLEFEFLT